MSHEIRDTGSVPTFYSNQVLEAERFYLDAVGSVRQPLAVVCGGRERCGPDYRIDRADFPFHSIEFVARGKGTLTLKGRTEALYPGRVFSYGPGVAHLIAAGGPEPLVKYFVDFTGPTAAKVLRDNDLAPGTAVRIASPDAVLRIFDDLIAAGCSGTRQGPAICAKLVELLVLRIAEAGLLDDPYRSAAFATYQSGRQYIRNHFATLRTLEEIAESCHVDEAYLCRLFKRFDRQSPYQYLTQLKMAQAARALQRNDKLIKQVAFELGYSDPFHFSRAFRKVFGLSPAAFRKLR